MKSRLVMMSRLAIIPAAIRGIFALLVATALVACGSANGKEQDPAFAAQLKSAERVLIGVAGKPVDADGGKTFEVKIERSFRGGGNKGAELQVVVPATSADQLKFEAGGTYLFLLKKAAGENRGWQALGDAIIPADAKKVGAAASAVTYEQLSKLLAENAFTAAAETAGRKSFAGRWIIVRTAEANDYFLWLVEITESKGKYSASLLATSKMVDSSTLEAATITADAADITIRSGSSSIRVLSKLGSDAALGCAIENGNIELARMVATELSNMKPYGEPKAAAGRSRIVYALNQEKPFDSLVECLKKEPNTPLFQFVHRNLLKIGVEEGKTSEELTKLADAWVADAARWHPLLAQLSRIELIATLSQAGAKPELLQPLIETARQGLTADSPKSWKLDLDLASATMFLAADKTAEALEIFRRLKIELPLNWQITFQLATAADAAGKVDEALPLYAELAVMPMVEQNIAGSITAGDDAAGDASKLPSRAVKRLWAAKHGKTGDGLEEDPAGLDAYLDEAYHKVTTAFAGEKVPARKPGDGNRVVLCEIFTGATCPPCVAADLAGGGLEAIYEPSEVIVVRYHQHIPGPDQLTVPDGLKRFDYYQAEGTPHIRFNGKEVSAGGYTEHTPDTFASFKQVVEPTLTEQVGVNISVEATAANGKINLAAKANGLATIPPDCKLRLLLVEDSIKMLARNGIRSHEWIVRAMPGGVDGIAAKESGWEFSETIDLLELKTSLAQYLVDYEAKRRTEFKDKPLDLAKLHVVAFVQNDRNKEILQAIAVPVTGDTSTGPIPDMKPSSKKKPAGKTPDADDDAADEGEDE